MSKHHDTNKANFQLKREKKMIELSSLGYNNTLIGKAYNLSRERVRQVLKHYKVKQVSRRVNPLLRSEHIFIIDLAQIGLTAVEIHNLIPEVAVESIRSLIKESGIKTYDHISRQSFRKHEEILQLAEMGYGVHEIRHLAKTHQDTIKKVVEANGFKCIRGSGIHRADKLPE